jgi:hypothetical protein
MLARIASRSILSMKNFIPHSTAFVYHCSKRGLVDNTLQNPRVRHP